MTWQVPYSSSPSARLSGSGGSGGSQPQFPCSSNPSPHSGQGQFKQIPFWVIEPHTPQHIQSSSKNPQVLHLSEGHSSSLWPLPVGQPGNVHGMLQMIGVQSNDAKLRPQELHGLFGQFFERAESESP